MKKHKLIMASIVAATIFTLGGCGTNNQVQPTAATYIPAVRALPTNNITVRGTVESTESRNVYSTLGLTIQQVNVEEGDHVTAGQVLAVLDTGDLELTISQQKATLEATRQATQNAIAETQRMLSEATSNLARNTNMHILTAEASLNAAVIQLEMSQQNYDNAMRDLTEGNDPHVLAAESFLRLASTELETMETTHENTSRLYDAGVVTREEMRLSENALTHLRNQYSDARNSYQNATQLQQRTIDQLRTAHQAAVTGHQNAQGLLSAARAAANQEIEMLRAAVTTAEIAANIEPMEIAIQLLERQLDDSIITAPISGTITAVIAREGAAGMGPLFVIDDTENLRIMTSFREYDIAMISTGMEVTIIPDAMGNVEYVGVINRINPAASPFSQIVEFEAEVLVASQNTDLRIGMNTRLDINLE